MWRHLWPMPMTTTHSTTKENSRQQAADEPTHRDADLATMTSLRVIGSHPQGPGRSLSTCNRRENQTTGVNDDNKRFPKALRRLPPFQSVHFFRRGRRQNFVSSQEKWPATGHEAAERLLAPIALFVSSCIPSHQDDVPQLVQRGHHGGAVGLQTNTP